MIVGPLATTSAIKVDRRGSADFIGDQRDRVIGVVGRESAHRTGNVADARAAVAIFVDNRAVRSSVVVDVEFESVGTAGAGVREDRLNIAARNHFDRNVKIENWFVRSGRVGLTAI